MVEKRTFKRFDFNKKINFVLSDGEIFSATVQNLSLKGGAVILDKSVPLAIGDIFPFKISFIDNVEIVIEGNAAIEWQQNETYGLSFTDLRDDYFHNLKRLLEFTYGKKDDACDLKNCDHAGTNEHARNENDDDPCDDATNRT